MSTSYYDYCDRQPSEFEPPSAGIAPTSYILLPTSYILHPASCILHPTSNILHPTSYILHPTSYILHPTGSPLSSSRYSSILLPRRPHRHHPTRRLSSRRNGALGSRRVSGLHRLLHLASYILHPTSYIHKVPWALAG